MVYLKPDPYNDPEKFGLTVIGEIEWDNEPYQFNLTVVWRHESGAVFIAHDSGCSCPSPFESLENVSVNEALASLERVESLKALEAILKSRAMADHRCNDEVRTLLDRAALMGVR